MGRVAAIEVERGRRVAKEAVASLHYDALRLGVLASRALLAASRTSLVGSELLQLGKALHRALVALSCGRADAISK